MISRPIARVNVSSTALSGTLDAGSGAIDNGAMAVRVPRLPFSLDPLIAEAKRRHRGALCVAELD
jgi:hypothetical protein